MSTGLLLLGRFLPWIKKQDAGRFEICRVSGHNVETVPSSGGGDKAVAGGNDPARFLGGGCDFSPDMARFEIDRKEAVLIGAFKGLQPALQGSLFVAFGEQSYSLGDLAG